MQCSLRIDAFPAVAIIALATIWASAITTRASATSGEAPRIVAIQPSDPDLGLGGRVLVGDTSLDTIAIEFDQAITGDLSQIRLRSSFSGTITVDSAALEEGDTRLRVTFPPVTAPDRLLLTVEGGLTSLTGIPVDGEMADPLRDLLPSGDGTPGGAVLIRVDLLTGDCNRDQTVNAADEQILVDALGSVPGDPNWDERADLNGDLVVNVLDAAVWSTAPRVSLPEAGPGQLQVDLLDLVPSAPLDQRVDQVRLAFDRPIDPASLFEGALRITTNGSAAPAPISVSYDAPSQVATFLLANTLQPCEVHTLALDPAVTTFGGSTVDFDARTWLLQGAPPLPAPVVDPVADTVADTFLTITGVADDLVDLIRVVHSDGVFEAPVRNGAFAVGTQLTADTINVLSVLGISTGCDASSAPSVVSIASDLTGPSISINLPAPDSVSFEEAVDVAGVVSDQLSGIEGLVVRVNGLPADVTPSAGGGATFFAPDVPLLPIGTPTRLVVVAEDALGNPTSKTIVIEQIAPPEETVTLTAVAGDDQAGIVGRLLPLPIVVEAADARGLPVPNTVVTIDVSQGDGTLTTDRKDDEPRTLQAITDGDGRVEFLWRLGSDAGAGNNQLTAVVTGGTIPLTICASGLPESVGQLNADSGTRQSIEAGAVAPFPFVVRATDGLGNGVAGVPVTFTVESGPGTFDGLASATVVTDASGRASASLLAGPDSGTVRVDATSDLLPDVRVTFEAATIDRDPLAPTVFQGVILDNAGRTVGGAGAVLINSESGQLEHTFSDVDGRFVLDDVDRGPAVLAIGGSLATSLDGVPIPEGSFPALNFDVFVIENAVNELPMPVLLPPLDPVNTRVYDGTESVILTIDGIDGLEFVVAADSVTRVDGSAPTPGDPLLLSLNPVHFDELPMPLPDGIEYPLAWTLQPGGTRFDPPVAIRTPNMTGEAPGSLVTILNFDHDTGRFEAVAPGRVTADGAFVESLPGLGIDKAGWGGFFIPPPPVGFAGNCAGLQSSRGLYDTVDFGLNFVGQVIGGKARDFVSLVRDGVAAARSCSNAFRAAVSDPPFTPEEGAEVAACARSAKRTVARSLAFTPVGSVISSAGALSSASSLVASGANAAGSSGCFGPDTGALLDAAGDTAATATSALQIASSANPVEFAVGASCALLQNVSDALSSDDPGAMDIEQLRDLFEQLDAEIAALEALTDDLEAVIDVAESTAQIAIASAEALLGQLPDQGGAAGCVVRVGGTTTVADERGGFTLQLPANNQLRRALFECVDDDGTMYAASEFFQVGQGATSTLQADLVFSPDPPPTPVSLTSGLTRPIVEVGAAVDLALTANMSDGTIQPVPGLPQGTIYQTSSTDVLAVDAKGAVSGIEAGVGFVVATNQGASLSRQVVVTSDIVSTTLVGVVIDEFGASIEGAVVTSAFGGETLTNELGAFLLEVDLPIETTEIRATATFDDGLVSLAGRSEPASVVADGLTDVGIFMIRDSVIWTLETDGLWTDPEAWSTGTVPTVGDDVVISTAAPITVTIPSGTHDVNSITCDEILRISGGVLSVVEPLEFDGLELAGGTMRDSVIRSGPSGFPVRVSGFPQIENVVVEAVVSVEANRRLEVVDDLVLDGRIELNSNSDLGFGSSEDQSLLGSGEVTLISDSCEIFATTGMLTIGPEMTIRGNGGAVGRPTDGPVVIEGLVEALGPSSISISGESVSIPGMLRANSGELLVHDLIGIVGPIEIQRLASVTLNGPDYQISHDATIDNATLSLGGTFASDGVLTATNQSSLNCGGVWINEGSIVVTDGSSLNCDGIWSNAGMIDMVDATVVLDGSFTLNERGQFQRSGGTVSLRGTLDNTGTTLALDADTGSWESGSGGRINGGVVRTLDGTSIDVVDSLTLTDVTLDGLISVDQDRTLIVRGDLMLNGRIGLNTSSDMRFDSPENQSIIGSGEIDLVTGNESTEIYASTGTLTIGPEITIRGRGGAIGRPDGGRIVIEGLVDSDELDTIVLYGESVSIPGTLRASVGGITANSVQGIVGTIEVQRFAFMTLDGSDYQLSQAVTLDGANLRLRGTWTNDTTITVTDHGTLTCDGTWMNAGMITMVDATVVLDGAFTLDSLGNFQRSGGTVSLHGTLDNTRATLTLDADTGPWESGSGGRINGGLVETLDGTSIDVVGNLTLADVTLDGLISVDLEQTLTVLGNLTLNGRIDLNGNSDIWFDSPEDQSMLGDGEVNLVTGTISNEIYASTGTLTIGPEITIRGRGGAIGRTNEGPVIIEGTVDSDEPNTIVLYGESVAIPGTIRATSGSIQINSEAVTTLSGNVELPSGVDIFCIGPLALTDVASVHINIVGGGPFQAGELRVLDVVQLGGSISVALDGSMPPPLGTSFDLVTSSQSLTGSFDVVDRPILPEGLVFEVETTSTSVIGQIVADDP